ncbi:MAG: hypothetical protein R6W83_02280 [Cryobacterium sp.]
MTFFTPVPAELTQAAYAQAAAAATAAGVTVRLADAPDMGSVIGLFERTWGLGRSPDRSLLLALDYAGNTVITAVANSQQIGAALGFLGWNNGLHLHSHMAAVVPWRRSAGVGYALKLFQRAVCLENGVTEMRWTFDPLIRRNAHFNLVKLGAEVTAFMPDFYGRLDDAITGSDRSDRFEVRWRLDSDRVRRALAGETPPRWTATERLPLDVDFEHHRADDPAAATALRASSRALFVSMFAAGLRPEVNGDNDYVFTTDAADTAAPTEGSRA